VLDYINEKDERFLTAKELRERHRVCDMTVWRRIQAGVYPAPIKLGNKRLWPASQIEALERAKGQ
jgi:predicted DNA-binding transcriptional regulator AlpA